MVTLTNKQIGILQPQLAYRWRLRAPNGFTEEEHNRIACQAQSIKFDYKNKKLIITLVQNAHDTILHEAVTKLVSRQTVMLHIDSLNGSAEATPNYILEFDCTPISHNFELDYTNQGGTANHTMEFEYTTMTPYNPKEAENEEIA